MPVEMAAWLVLQACEAVAEAHACGIVHRDLKPQNLFLTRTVGGSPKLKVLDFGVSKAVGLTSGGVGALTRTRAMLGSPLYMAPEQMRSSRDVDARVDVWALGIVLFELLTGRWPFEAETMPELCLKVVSEPPMALATFRNDVPREFAEVIERCLEKEARLRFANAAELATALEPFVPPASRVLAEHARLAIQSAPTSGPRSSNNSFVDIPALASSTGGTPRAASLPAAWGGATDPPFSPPTGVGRRVAWWSIGAVALLTAGGLLVARVGRHGPAAPVTVTPAHEILEPTPTAPPHPPALAAPPPSVVPSIEIGAAAHSSTTTPPAVVAGPPSAVAAPPAAVVAPPPVVVARPTTPPRPPVSHPPTSVRPTTSDDDIPALR
jgi:serine/threonine-protein kinase